MRQRRPSVGPGMQLSGAGYEALAVSEAPTGVGQLSHVLVDMFHVAAVTAELAERTSVARCGVAGDTVRGGWCVVLLLTAHHQTIVRQVDHRACLRRSARVRRRQLRRDRMSAGARGGGSRGADGASVERPVDLPDHASHAR